MNVLVIGNGPSRKLINIPALKDELSIYNTIGCNTIYKDFVPDHLVVWDLDTFKQVVNEFCTDYDYFEKLVCPYPNTKAYSEPNSGHFAVRYAVKELKAKEVYLLGFDHFLQTDTRGDTLTVSPENGGRSYVCDKYVSDERAKAILSLMKSFKKVKFFILHPPKTKLIDLRLPLINRHIRTMPFPKGLLNEQLSESNRVPPKLRLADIFAPPIPL